VQNRVSLLSENFPYPPKFAVKVFILPEFSIVVSSRAYWSE
jgi:hypothetical protein